MKSRINKGIILVIINKGKIPFINIAVLITASENRYTFWLDIKIIVLVGNASNLYLEINFKAVLELVPLK